MRFLTEDEAKPIIRTFKVPDVDKRRKARLLYEYGLMRYDQISAPLVREIGTFDAAFLWIDDVIFGDSYEDGTVKDSRWRDYYEWRRRNGDDRRIRDVRGCLFDGNQSTLLADAVTFAIVLGCDAHVMVRPGRTLLKISHDDYIDVVSGVNARKIIARMEKLGCKVLR